MINSAKENPAVLNALFIVEKWRGPAAKHASCRALDSYTIRVIAGTFTSLGSHEGFLSVTHKPIYSALEGVLKALHV